jgi:ABC-type phosphate/phosphonate transport system substrate-binding protein
MGRSLNSKAAVAAGLADRVATLEDVISRVADGRLSLSSMERLDEVWETPSVPQIADESWKDVNATEAMRSRLRMSGVLAGDAR